MTAAAGALTSAAAGPRRHRSRGDPLRRGQRAQRGNPQAARVRPRRRRGARAGGSWRVRAAADLGVRSAARMPPSHRSRPSIAARMLDTLRSVVRSAASSSTPPSAGWPRRRTPTTCGGSPSAGSLAGVFDYIDGGAEDERTMRANRQAFANYRFRPRVPARRVGGRHDVRPLLGKTIPLPLVLAPTGFTRIADPARRAGRRPRRPAGRPAVHAVDALDALDRGGRRGQRRRPPLVPGLRLEGQGLVARHGRPGCCRRLRGARDHRRHGQPRPSRA